MMNEVYEWAGSVSDFPDSFEISAKWGKTMFPYIPKAENTTVLLMRKHVTDFCHAKQMSRF